MLFVSPAGMTLLWLLPEMAKCMVGAEITLAS